jgi:SAM-dependent methyltransferase
VSLFWRLHSGLPREGPGSDESTLKALRTVAGSLPAAPRILDVGCGPGMQTLVLARETAGHVTAVDCHQPFLDELNRRAARQGLTERIATVNASMSALDFPDAAFDLIWSEGAIYVMGFAEGLRAWKRLLKRGGVIAVTEISWLGPNIPEEAATFWRRAYSAMTDVATNLRTLESVGYAPLAHFVLPEAAWWDHYYAPLEQRIDALQDEYRDDQEALAFLHGERTQITLYRKYSASYGYVFYLARNAPQTDP